MSAFSRASGRDLGQWTVDWLDRAGTDTVTVDGHEVVVEAPDGGDPRPHRLDVGSYSADGALLGRTSIETSGRRTTLEDLPAGGLVLPNDTDLSFVAVRTADDSLRRLLSAAGGLPDATARAVAVATSLDMLRKGELSAADMLDCVLGVVAVEKNPALIEPFLGQANAVAELWTPADEVAAARARVADQALALTGDADLRLGALQVLAASASTPQHDAALDAAAADDVDLAWRVAVRRAEQGRHDEQVVADLLARDPDPDSASRAVAVTAARPDAEAKAEAWRELFEVRSVQSGSPTYAVARAFWRPGQDELVAPYADGYLDQMREVRGGLLSMLSLVRGMFPLFADEAFVARAREVAEQPGTDPTVRGQLLTGADTLQRMIRARSA